MENYFTYFTEIEEHYQRRRGGALLLSTLDWALIETWKDAGVPLEAVLRGIDETFDKYDRKPPRAKTRKINSLAYCAQEVLAAVQDAREAATGAARKEAPSAGFEEERVRAFLRANAAAVRKRGVAALAPVAEKLEELAGGPVMPQLEELERNLSALEEKMLAALLAAASHDELVKVRAEAEREISPYRSKMNGAQIEQLTRQFVNKRLLEQASLPRLSLFYL